VHLIDIANDAAELAMPDLNKLQLKEILFY